MLTYLCPIKNNEYIEDLKILLEWERIAFNEASKIQFKLPKNSIVDLHNKFYKKFRKKHPEIPSQIIIKAEQAVLSAYRSIKSNKYKITVPCVKKKLSLQLDKRLYSYPTKTSINITTRNKRQKFEFHVYPKVKELLEKYEYRDPKLVINNKGKLCIALTFDVPSENVKQNKVLGVDLGIRVSAACSDGRLIIDKEFNQNKRKLRYLKRCLNRSKAKGSQSAKKHLNKIQHKEQNINKNQTHLIANEILKTEANVIALEDLSKIKRKKHIKQNKNRISQVPFYILRQFLTYKAQHMGKTVVAVKPHYTSQTDSVTGKVEGERKGRRFLAKSGLVYDADINAAINIAKRTKLPVSQGNLLDGQAAVNRPNANSNLFG